MIAHVLTLASLHLLSVDKLYHKFVHKKQETRDILLPVLSSGEPAGVPTPMVGTRDWHDFWLLAVLRCPAIQLANSKSLFPTLLISLLSHDRSQCIALSLKPVVVWVLLIVS